MSAASFVSRHRRARLGVAGLVVGALALVPAPGRAEGRLGHAVVPTFEAVSLEVDAARSDYGGRVEIALEAREATSEFRLYARDMTLVSLELRGAAGALDVQHEESGDEVRIRAAAPLSPGPYTLTIAFEAPFNTKAVALYRMEQDGLPYAFTQFEAADARGAFPCFDEPGFKIPWQLTVRVPEAHVAVSNTPAESETTAGGWRTVAFRKTKPLPSYLVALATGPLETVDMPGLGVPGRIVTTKGQGPLTKVAAELAPPLLKALERYFGRPYPYAKLDFIAIPEYWPGAMEHPGAITYAASLFLLDSDDASVAQRRRLAKVIAHEMAHMWFGDLVTMEWWDDLWLNESFADWMGDKVTGEVFPEFRTDLEVVSDMQDVMVGDARPTASPIRRPVETPDSLLQDVGVQYAKGKAVLNMFEAWIGPETLRKGVLAYLDENAWGNATSDDLWRALDAASEGRASAPLATFVEQPGLPLVTVERVDAGRVRLSQSRFANAGVELAPLTWSVPVRLAYGTGARGGSRDVLLGPEPVTVDIGPEATWLYPNADARGYYRWRLPADDLSRLTRDSPERLAAAERMDLAGNLSALLGAGLLHGGDLLAALQRLAADPEPMVVGAVLDHLDALEEAFVPRALEAQWGAYLRHSLRPALDRIGMLPRPGESDTAAFVRPRLLRRLGDEGEDPGVRRFAREQAAALLQDPRAVPPSIAPACLALFAMDSDAARFEDLTRRFEAAKTPTERGLYLQALGMFRDPALVDRALDYAFSGPLRTNELFAIPQGVGETAEGRERLWRWMTENYSRLGERLPPEFMGFMPFFAGGCSAERLGAARTFFADPAHQGPGTDRTLGRVAARVEGCLSLRSREGEDVRRFLEQPDS
jgi:alanyl aminopeptidase